MLLDLEFLQHESSVARWHEMNCVTKRFHRLYLALLLLAPSAELVVCQITAPVILSSYKQLVLAQPVFDYKISTFINNLCVPGISVCIQEETGKKMYFV